MQICACAAAATMLVSSLDAQAATGAPAHPAGTVIVSNMRDNTATVLDAASGVVLATLPTGEGPHEVAASHDGRWAVVSNYGVAHQDGSTLSVIALDSLRVVATMQLAPHHRPHGMAFLPGDSVLAVTSETSQAVLLLSFPEGRLITTVPTQGRVSHMLAVPPAASGRVFTTNIADGSISQLDLERRTFTRMLPVAKLVEGIAISPDARTVWVGSNGDKIVVVVDVQRGQPVDTIRGFGLPYRMAFSPDGRSAVVTDPMRGEVRIFDAPTRRQRFLVSVPADSVLSTAEVAGSASPEGVAISADSRWAFVTLQGRNRLMTLDLATGKIVGYAPTGTWSDGIAYSTRVIAPMPARR